MDMKYKVILASADYCTIVLFSPHQSQRKLSADGTYLYFDGELYQEAIKEVAVGYCNRYCQDHGEGYVPDKVFKSLEEVEEWRKKKAEPYT